MMTKNSPCFHSISLSGNSHETNQLLTPKWSFLKRAQWWAFVPAVEMPAVDTHIPRGRTWVQDPAPAPGFSFLLMWALGGSSAGWVT